uniref:Uncharacterized protein n=1 Tax=viral metagenome TaxID=1070528 RepID=A0A6C0LF26_9ZZZZ
MIINDYYLKTKIIFFNQKINLYKFERLNSKK